MHLLNRFDEYFCAFLFLILFLVMSVNIVAREDSIVSYGAYRSVVVGSDK